MIFHVNINNFCKCPVFNPLRPSDAYMSQQTNHHWFRSWLVAWTVPSHYLNQWRNIVNLTLMNNLQWNSNQYSNIFIKENPFQNVVWKMAAILSRPQCVNGPDVPTFIFSSSSCLRNMAWWRSTSGSSSWRPGKQMTHNYWKHVFYFVSFLIFVEVYILFHVIFSAFLGNKQSYFRSNSENFWLISNLSSWC